MTIKNFFTGRAVVVGIILIIGGGYIAFSQFSKVPESDEALVPSKEAGATEPIFSWEFEEADSLNLDGQPETNVILTITHEGKVPQRKLVETSQSGCNELPDPEEGSVPGTTAVLCYGAGLGYMFKITQSTEAYLIERKMFEEGSPDHTPLSQEYEVIHEFPF